jgi:cytochrome c-type biogenesis protein CcmI
VALDTAIYLAAILIVAAAALFVAAPLIEGVRPRRRAAAPERERLEHQRALAVQGLRELEFDHEMGKLDEGDYAALKRTLEERALAAMAALERLAAPATTNGAARVTPEPGGAAQLAPFAGNGTAAITPKFDLSAPHRDDARFCPQCGERLDGDARACSACGAAVAPAAGRTTDA